jgi:hypothetical protein
VFVEMRRTHSCLSLPWALYSLFKPVQIIGQVRMQEVHSVAVLLDC